MTTRIGDWMQTYTGRQFWPLDPRPDEIFIEDIAHALSMQCRYAGHCIDFYCTAQHSVLLAEAIRQAGGTRDEQRWALMHDAPETYLVDVPRPVKPYLTGYRTFEDAIMAAICTRFGLSPVMPALVHEFDGRIIGDERANLKPCVAAWYTDHPPLGIAIEPWAPRASKAAFLSVFEQLFPEFRP